jgi:hypothetical protein
MTKTLSDEDVETVALRVVALLGERLTAATPPPLAPATPAAVESKGAATRLAYTLKQLCAELSLSPDTVYKLEACGRIKSLPGIRRKIYSRAEVERFLAGGKARW